MISIPFNPLNLLVWGIGLAVAWMSGRFSQYDVRLRRRSSGNGRQTGPRRRKRSRGQKSGEMAECIGFAVVEDVRRAE